MTKKSPVFINLFMHTMDSINVEYSHPAIRRILDLFDEVGVPADIYLESRDR